VHGEHTSCIRMILQQKLTLKIPTTNRD